MTISKTIIFKHIAALTLCFPLAVTSIQASGELSTTTDTQPGQVQTQRSGDTLYLTTNVNAGDEATPGSQVATPSATPSASPAESSTSSGLIRSDIVIPTGYATDFGLLLNSVLTLVMVIAALLVFMYLIWGGIQWITSGGDKGKTEAARNKITAAIIGLVILAASYAILLIALRFLGFTSIRDVFENVDTIS